MPKPNSKRSRALDELGHAEASIAKAISLLGGFTRAKYPRKNKSDFVARKMLEGVDLRLHAIVNLLAFGQPSVELGEPKSVALEIAHDYFQRTGQIPVDLRDAFEKEYDSTRRPMC